MHLPAPILLIRPGPYQPVPPILDQKSDQEGHAGHRLGRRSRPVACVNNRSEIGSRRAYSLSLSYGPGWRIATVLQPWGAGPLQLWTSQMRTERPCFPPGVAPLQFLVFARLWRPHLRYDTRLCRLIPLWMGQERGQTRRPNGGKPHRRHCLHAAPGLSKPRATPKERARRAPVRTLGMSRF